MPAKKATTRKSPAPKAPSISAPIVVDAGDCTKDRAPLGAHVSIAGGTWEAAARAREISATAAQVFTKQANRWLERDIDADEADKFGTAMRETQVRWTCAHDSYLINLASPDAELRAKSVDCFRGELRRCHAAGLDALVSHPGNYMDERQAGIARNADAITIALEAEPGPTRLLMELTAGQGTVLGSTFEEMADLLSRIPVALRSRVGVCLDTAHIWAAGYDIATQYDDVMAKFGDTIGFGQLGCLHLNDSKAKLGSHLDRHECIAEGTIGELAFRRIMTDERLAAVPKIIETPKGDTPAETDGRMLRLLRSYAVGALAAIMLALQPRAASAQGVRTPDSWQLVGEAAGIIGGTWLEGPAAPTVSSRTGFLFGLGARRGISERATAGVVARVGLQPIRVRDHDEQWDAGTLTEVDALGTLSYEPMQRSAVRLALDVGAGAAFVHDARRVLPFDGASAVSPAGEIGVTIGRGDAADAARFAARRDIALIFRYSALRMSNTSVTPEITSGWVGRFIAGLRVTR